MKIECSEWVRQTDDSLFYEDLRAALDGVECGQLHKIIVTQLCEKNGYSFNWDDYSLKKNNHGLLH